MGDWNVWAGGNYYESHGMDYSTTQGFRPSEVGLANNVKSQWEELVPSASADWGGFWLFVTGDATLYRRALIDVAIGDSGSEASLIENVPYYLEQSTGAGTPNARQYYVPLAVPSGSRLAVRYQQHTNAATAEFFVHILGHGSTYRTSPPFGVIDIYGVDETDTTIGTRATLVAADTMSEWREVTDGCLHDIKQMWTTTFPSSSTGELNTQHTIWEVGVGPSGSEVSLVIGSIRAGAREHLNTAHSGPYAVSIPSGSRLVMRGQVDTGTARLPAIAIWGLG